jgi:hypothetical protein
VNFYGPSDLTAMYDMTPSPVAVHDALQKYIGGPPGLFPDRFTALSPVTYVSAKSPPTITILGLSYRIVPREQADALDRALAAVGVARETYLLRSYGFSKSIAVSEPIVSPATPTWMVT